MSYFPNMFSMNSFVFLCFFSVVYSKVCDFSNQPTDLSTSRFNATDAFLVSCPRPEDPPHFSDCCYSEIGTCCELKQSISSLFGLNEQFLIAISVAVIAMCIVSAILVLTCCFWSKCPLYTCSACPVNYQHDEAIAFTTKEEMMKLNGMPDEDGNHQQSFEPNAVKIRPVFDV